MSNQAQSQFQPKRITVLGGGAWGTALATNLSEAGHQTLLWARDEETIRLINQSRLNQRYLPDVLLHEGLTALGDPAKALDGAEIILSVIPAQSMRAALGDFAHHVPTKIPLISCSKGIERGTGHLPSAILTTLFPDNPAGALSGPSFASDLARGLPTAVTVATRDADQALELATALSTSRLRCYASADLTGVEIGGALKNVLALAAGAAAGAGLGASAQAALITRGFVELRRIGQALGAQAETLMGLSGLGDLILTCGSTQSRNFAYGMAMGRGEDLEGRPLAEGVATAVMAVEIAAKNQIEAPIIEAVDAIISRKMTIYDAIEALMNRPLKHE